MESDVRASIAREVRAELARQNKSGRDLAVVLDLDHTSTWLRVKGDRSFRGEELAVLAEWLGVPVDHFMPPVAEPAEPVAS